MRNICIGCGCDENNACLTNVGGMLLPCNWLRFDGDERTGVCSSCEDLVKGWRGGPHKPIWPMIAERFYRQVLTLQVARGYGDAERALAWMATPQPGLFGGRSPRAMILDGRLDEVQTVLEGMRSGAIHG